MAVNLEYNLNLIPCQKYLLKWAIKTNTNAIHNMVVLECEFTPLKI